MEKTKDNRWLLTDRNNRNVKLFAPDMTFQSSVTFDKMVWDVAVISDEEAVVSSHNHRRLVIYQRLSCLSKAQEDCITQ